DPAGQVVLGLRPLPGLRLLDLEPAGGGGVRDLRLGRAGAQGEQGGGRGAHLPPLRPPRGHRGAGGDDAGVKATVVGGGLAGCEAAWALAERGVEVTLYEMRPVVKTPAHQTDRLGELV